MVKDLSSIPYDAPLSFKEPHWTWTKYYAYLNENSTTLSEKDVPIKNLSGKWIIISGGNNGIGSQAAKFFAQCGANLIIACRDPPPHETHPEVVVKLLRQEAQARGYEKSTIEWWKIDMSKLASVDAFASRWLETGRPLDVLCNNAGTGGNPGGLGKVLMTEDGLEFVHQVNFISHVLLTLRLLPSLAKAKEPRVVCTTSCFTFLGKYNLLNWDGTGCKGVDFYANNKLYFQVWLTEMNQRLLRSSKPGYKHITINGVHPGYVNSGIWTFDVGKGPFAVVAMLARAFLQWLASLLAINTEQGSYCIRHVATSLEAGPDPATQGVGEFGGKGGGRWFNRIWEQPNMPHNHDEDARLRVWRKAAEEIHAKEKGLLDGLE
ncbi:hypothetical protein AMS68_007959 [Peltaster fructicola]|uniref:NAD(P)-binding protein n=1 Tax=Peltaster fructicola TaxID=286661 RepID=A0A6H0Y5X0_9PEZI|nr:hypothetical protein AMS68_007959 [Peltaster fructicola]